MPSARPLRALLAATAATAAVLVPAGLAAADEPAGETVVGRLVQTQSEAGPGAAPTGAASLSWIETGQGAVRVPSADLAGVPTGSTVSVTLGGEAADQAAAEGVQPARDVVDAQVLSTGRAAALPDRRLTNQVTVALVAPQGSEPDAVTLDQVVSAVDGPVADFWSEQSDGAISVGVTAAHDWVTTQAGCANSTELWNETARAVGFRPGAGQHLLIYLSTDAETLPGCEYALAEVGAGIGAGGRLYVRDVLPSLIAHELGHNFGLGHSSELQCADAVDHGSCATQPYRDLYDVMGFSWERTGSLNAAQAARLGLLPGAAQRSLRAGDPATTTVLAPLGGRAGTRALHLDGASAGYWLEYRTATGRDDWLGSEDNVYGLETGVLLRRSGGLPDTSVLLDGSPSAPGAWEHDHQTALPVGAPVALAGGWSITVLGVTEQGATVAVVPGPGAPAPSAPAPAGTGGVLPSGPAADAADAAVAAADSATDGAEAAPQPPAGTVLPPTRVPAERHPSPATVEAAALSPLSSSLAMTAAAVALAGALWLGVRRLRRTRLR